MIGRKQEIDYLTQQYQKTGSQLLVLYGQKFIGKTYLLNTFCEGLPFNYYKARSCSERQQRYFWSNQLQKEKISLSEFPSYQEILNSLHQLGEGKKVIVIDDFQNLIHNSNEFMTELVSVLTEEASKQEYLMILCSSYVGFVENNLVSKIGATAQHINGFFKIKPLSFDRLREHFHSFDTETAIKAYAVLGKLPGRWQFFSNHKSIKENICKYLLEPNSKLINEGTNLIESQLRETSVYNTILSTLAEGKQKLNDLYLHTGYSRAKISVYLKNLIALEVVRKEYSIDTKGYANTQKGIYKINDPFIDFYFTFIYPHLSELSMMEKEDFYQTYIEPDFDDYLKPYFNDVCREFLVQYNQEGLLPIRCGKIGEWIGKKGRIPILAIGEGNTNLVGFCSWSKSNMKIAEYEELLETLVQAAVDPTYIYLFSLHGFDERLTTISQKMDHIIIINMN